MSGFSLKKKVFLSKKGWRSFTSNLQFKFRMLKRSKLIKQATNILHRRRPYRTRCRPRHKNKVHVNNLHHYYSRFGPVYVDGVNNLNRVEAAMQVDKKAENSAMTMAATCYCTDYSPSPSAPPLPSESLFSVDGKRSVNVSEGSLDPSCCVDTRAEIFITKIKEQMRLERQRSIEEYHAMLARGM